ncbi:hypothetical protein ACIRYZ_45290 [Kitasatospora sp. NPDC101155]|uniref:hypothetical protein n=1 Tax=Kitasatospora sp. NPDC101155 TaxID=3364097 RepID=UPI00382351FE
MTTRPAATSDAEAFIEWWLAASDEERQQFVEDSTPLPQPTVRPRIRNVIRDLADYQPRSAR